jgi:hypothetical protein
MAGARRLAEHAAATNTPQRYVPRLKNWLLGKRWDDKLKAPQPKAANKQREVKGDGKIKPKPAGLKVGARVTETAGLYRTHVGEVGEVIAVGDGAFVQWPSGKMSYGNAALSCLRVLSEVEAQAKREVEVEVDAQERVKSKLKHVWHKDSGDEGVVVAEGERYGSPACEISWLATGTRGWYYRSDLSFKRPDWSV